MTVAERPQDALRRCSGVEGLLLAAQKLEYKLGSLVEFTPRSKEQLRQLKESLARTIEEAKRVERDMLDTIKCLEDLLREVTKTRRRLQTKRRQSEKTLERLSSRYHSRMSYLRKWTIEHFGEVLELMERTAGGMQ